MKTLGLFLIIALSILLFYKIAECFRFIKLHKLHIEQLTTIIDDLKKKQSLLTQQYKIIHLSDINQKNKIQVLVSNTHELLDKYLSSHN